MAVKVLVKGKLGRGKLSNNVVQPMFVGGLQPFSRVVSEWLAGTGLPQEWLAKRVGTTQAMISKYCLGKTLPEPSRVIQLAKAMGISPVHLLKVAGYLSEKDMHDILSQPTKPEVLQVVEQLKALPEPLQDAFVQLWEVFEQSHQVAVNS